MFEKKDKKIDLGIEPMKIFFQVLGGIGSVITIVLAIIFLDLLIAIIWFMVIIIIYLVAYLIAIIKRLVAMKDEFNNSVKDYNYLLVQYNFGEENRESLAKMYEDKTEELRLLEIKYIKFEGTSYLLYYLLSKDDNNKVDMKQLKKVVYPEEVKESNDNEETK